MRSKDEQDLYEKFLARFDSIDYKERDSSKINSDFQEIIGEFIQKELNDNTLRLDLDCQVFSTRKSFQYQDDEIQGTVKGLSWQIAGVQETKDGTEVPFYWPDVRKFTKTDFEYFEQRYKATNNLYAKTEYGLMVYFGQKTDWSRDNRFKLQLCKELLSLSQEFYHKAQEGDYSKLGNTLNTLELALRIAINGKFEDCLKTIVEQIFNIQQEWNIDDTPNTRHVPLNYSRLMLEHYTICKKYIDFTKVVERNTHAISLIEKENLYSAADAIMFTDKIKQKIQLPIEDSLRHKAEIYEKIAEMRKGDIASVHFIELALDIYRKMKDNTKIEEMEKLYSEKRNTFQLTEISTPIPDDYIKAINDAVKQMIEVCTEDELLDQFADTPWYETDDSIQTLAEATENGLIDDLPLSSMDKRGNMIKTYTPEEGKFWSTYSFFFKIGTLKMIKLFMAAIESQKLSYDLVLTYLERTWVNEPIERNYNGKKVAVVPLDTIKPGLKRIFEELRHTEEDYVPDYVTIIDSLTLKIEGLLRFFIERLQIPTFAKRRSKDGGEVMMEKLFDDIIADLKGTPERPSGFVKDHLTMLKYIMSEKIGWNLRNEVAHSLLQIEEYSLDKVVVLFCLILKLSKYTFKEQQEN